MLNKRIYSQQPKFFFWPLSGSTGASLGQVSAQGQ